MVNFFALLFFTIFEYENKLEIDCYVSQEIHTEHLSKTLLPVQY